MNNDWELKRIDEVATVVSGGTPSREVDEFWNGDINWVTPTDITRDNRRTLKTTKEKITKKGLRGSSTKMLPAGTLLMTSRATLVEIKIAETEVCTNQGFKSLIPFESIDSWFLFYQMKNHKIEYERYGIGTTFLEVNKSDTDRFLLPFPKDKLIQTKIAKILTTIDNVIEKTEAAIAKYEAIKQGMMHDLFTRGIGIDGQLRPIHTDAPELYKESVFGWIPREWGVKKIESIAKSLGDAPFGSMLKSVDYKENGVPVIQGNNVKDFKFYWKNKLYTSDEKFNSLRRSHAIKGDLVFPKIGTIGGCAILPKVEENDKVLLSTNMMKVDINSRISSNTFILNYFNFIFYSEGISKISKGSSQAIFNFTMLKNFIVPIPKIEEQTFINNKASSMNKMIDSEKSVLVNKSK